MSTWCCAGSLNRGLGCGPLFNSSTAKSRPNLSANSSDSRLLGTICSELLVHQTPLSSPRRVLQVEEGGWSRLLLTRVRGAHESCGEGNLFFFVKTYFSSRFHHWEPDKLLLGLHFPDFVVYEYIHSLHRAAASKRDEVRRP